MAPAVMLLALYTVEAIWSLIPAWWRTVSSPCLWGARKLASSCYSNPGLRTTWSQQVYPEYHLLLVLGSSPSLQCRSAISSPHKSEGLSWWAWRMKTKGMSNSSIISHPFMFSSILSAPTCLSSRSSWGGGQKRWVSHVAENSMGLSKSVALHCKNVLGFNH
jgi:hypothetical protein